jgi:hypothetical protein
MKTKILFASGLAELQMFTLSSATLIAQAAGPCIAEKGVECPKDFGSDASPTIIVDLVNKVANWMFTLLLIIAVVYIILAAFNYLTSEGNEEKVTAAHKALVYAAVAIAVAVLSRGFVYVIRNIVEGKDVSTQSSQQAQTGGSGDASTGTDATSQKPIPPTFSIIAKFTEFPIKVQLCVDVEAGKILGSNIPGAYVYNEDKTRAWSNIALKSDDTADLEGNPKIGPGLTLSKDLSSQPNAGQIESAGSILTGIWPFRKEYKVEVEVCNDGKTPTVIYSTEGGATGTWKQL